jgi:hypothetical protein
MKSIYIFPHQNKINYILLSQASKSLILIDPIGTPLNQTLSRPVLKSSNLKKP